MLSGPGSRRLPEGLPGERRSQAAKSNAVAAQALPRAELPLCRASSPHRLFPRVELGSGCGGRDSRVVAQGSVAPPHVASSWARNGNCAPTIGRRIPNPWPTRDARESVLKNADCTAHVVEPQRQERGGRGPAVRLSAVSSCVQGPCSEDGQAASGVDSGGERRAAPQWTKGLRRGGLREQRSGSPTLPRRPGGRAYCRLLWCLWRAPGPGPVLSLRSVQAPGAAGSRPEGWGVELPGFVCACAERGVPLSSSVPLMCLLLPSSLKDDLEEESAAEGDHPGRLWVSVPARERTPWWRSSAALRGAGSPCCGAGSPWHGALCPVWRKWWLLELSDNFIRLLFPTW